MNNVEIKYSFLPFLLVLSVLFNVSFLLMPLGLFYFGLFTLCLLYLLIIGGKLRVNYSLLVVVVLIVFSSTVVNKVPSVFNHYQRLVAFIIMISLIGPFFSTIKLDLFKWKLFEIFNIGIVIMVTLSFLGLLLNLNFIEGRGGFVGMFNHSMVMGPFAAISFLINIYWFFSNKSKTAKLIYFLLACVSFICLIQAGSRSAILALGFGVLFYFFKIYQYKMEKFIGSIIVLLFLCVVSFPIWQDYTERLMWKMEYAEEQGDLAATRTSLWDVRLSEFSSSPVFGVGFSNDTSVSIIDLIEDDGQIEPGSGWLAILSMTGLIGFLPIVFIFVSAFYFILKADKSRYLMALLGSLLMFFCVHLLAEGYIFAAGSAQFFYLWLLLGVIGLIIDRQKMRSIFK